MPLRNTEKDLGSNADTNKYFARPMVDSNKGEGFEEMWNGKFYPLFADLLEKNWEESLEESEHRMEDEKLEYKKK